MTRSAAPVSAGASAELEHMVRAFSDDPAARELLHSDGDAGEILDALRARSIATRPGGFRTRSPGWCLLQSLARMLRAEQRE
jgi:hypothetical protein